MSGLSGAMRLASLEIKSTLPVAHSLAIEARRGVPDFVERCAFGVLALTALSFAYERLEPSLGLTQDLRLTNLRLVASLAIGLWLLACLRARRWPRRPTRVAVPLAVWLAVLLASAIAAPTYQTQALSFVRDVAFGVAVGWVAFDLARSGLRQHVLVRALALGGAGVALLGLGEAASIGPLVDWLAGFKYQSFSIGELARISSTLPHPNIAAMVLELTLPILVVWAALAQQFWARAVLGVAVLAGLACLVLTFSRSGMVVLLVVFGLMAVAGARRRQPALVVASLATAGGLAALVAWSIGSSPLLVLHLSSQGAQDLYGAAYSPPPHVMARPGESLLVPVRVSNTGLRTWQADGDHPFALSYHLYRADQTPVTYDGSRSHMPTDVAPGASVEIQAELAAPVQPGEYVVDWDEVQESATWFSWTGTPPGRTDLTVAGTPVSLDALPITPPPDLKASLPSPNRLLLWRMALRMARHLPALGVGPDNFRWVYGDYAGVTGWDTGVHANNLYLEWLADTGVLGLAAFVWLMWELARALGRSLVRAPGSRAVDRSWLWQLALAASLTCWFVHGLTDYFYEPLPTNLGFWLIVGLALSVADLRQSPIGGA